MLNECLRILIDCSQLSKTYYNVLFGSFSRDHCARRIYRWTKITGKASNTAQNLQLYRVVRFCRPRSSCTMTHISEDVQRITLNASCMRISGGRTKQLDILCHVTGFTSDFLSFIVVELIRFFHRAIQLLLLSLLSSSSWSSSVIVVSVWLP